MIYNTIFFYLKPRMLEMNGTFLHIFGKFQWYSSLFICKCFISLNYVKKSVGEFYSD